jgi:hypothetical protein
MTRPYNDRCERAVNLTTTTSAAVTGDSSGAFPHGMENATCSLHKDSRGLFYKVLGTGKTLAVTLTTTDATPDDVTFEMAILSDTCEQCLAFSDFLMAEETPHTFEFDSEVDQTYILLVSGQGFSDVGSIQLELKVRAMFARLTILSDHRCMPNNYFARYSL